MLWFPKHVPLVYYVCSVLDIDTEKRCSILFFCLKMSIEFDTSSTFCIFFIVKSAYEAIFINTQYRYFFLFKFSEQVKC